VGALGKFVRPLALRIDLFEKFTSAANRSRLYAICHLAQRFVASLLRVGRQRLGLVRPLLAFVEACAFGERRARRLGNDE